MAKQEYTQEELQHYLAHPEEIDATNADLVNKLAEMELPEDMKAELKSGGKDAGDATGEDSDAAEAKAAIAEAEAKVAAEQAAEDAKGAKQGDRPKVLTKDGKHALPFEVLEEARQGKTAAEEALAEAQRTIIALHDRVQGKQAQARAAQPDQTDQVLADLRASLPELEKEAPWQIPVVQKTIAALEIMNERMAELANARQEDEQAVVTDLRQDANAALEANPTLVLWQSKAPDLYEEAVKADMFIRRDPDMRERYTTFEDRFAAAVRIVRANHDGEAIPLPEEVAQPSGKPARPSASDVTARAKAVLDKASAEAVRTLSDIPGGAGEMTAQEALESKSVEELAAFFDKMTPQQIVEFTMRTG